MPLDSDVANADLQLHVEFYECERDPYKGVPFVRIMTPGDKTNIIEQPVRDDHKRRFPRQWFAFQSDVSAADVIGTPVSVWHKERPEECNSGALTELQILKFLTVEQLAMASDGQIMRIGMGGTGLRDRARAYLSSRNAQASGAELASAQAEIEKLKAMVANIASMQGAAPLEAAKPKTKRAGWPKGKKRAPKIKVKHDKQHDAGASAAGGE